MENKKGEIIDNKALVVRKTNFYDKISNFFKKILKNKKEKDNVITYQSTELNINKKVQNFQDSLKIERDLEEERLLNLQKRFENNLITEDEISENDKIELKGLYYIQMLKSKMKIKIYKERIAKNKMQME